MRPPGSDVGAAVIWPACTSCSAASASRSGSAPAGAPSTRAETVHTGIDWGACVLALTEASPKLGSWAHAAATQARDALGTIGAGDLPVTVIHGDFHEQNVHYEHGHLAGVVDFALTHLDSRPYELAIARTYRAPETADSYCAELARLGWPLSELEEAALGPVSRAFRVDMAAWQMDHGRRTGRYDLAMIERQLSKTGTAPP
jgi:aminoglycoside phosphotransferase (APT) family kinase protein